MAVVQPPLDKVYGLALEADDDPLQQYRSAAERQARTLQFACESVLIVHAACRKAASEIAACSATRCMLPVTFGPQPSIAERVPQRRSALAFVRSRFAGGT
jgi:hypothetical protein